MEGHDILQQKKTTILTFISIYNLHSTHTHHLKPSKFDFRKIVLKMHPNLLHYSYKWITQIEKIPKWYHTSKWLFAWTDHSSLVENIRPHNSQDHDNCWWVCGIVKPTNDALDWWWLCEWTIFCETGAGDCWIKLVWWSKVCLVFSLLSSFFLMSKRRWPRNTGNN